MFWFCLTHAFGGPSPSVLIDVDTHTLCSHIMYQKLMLAVCCNLCTEFLGHGSRWPSRRPVTVHSVQVSGVQRVSCFTVQFLTIGL